MSARRTQHSQQVVEGFEDKLSTEHFGILMAAAGTDGEYASISAVFSDKIPMGTIKSRLNRARAAIEALIEDDKQQARIDKNNDAARNDEDQRR